MAYSIINPGAQGGEKRRKYAYKVKMADGTWKKFPGFRNRAATERAAQNEERKQEQIAGGILVETPKRWPYGIHLETHLKAVRGRSKPTNADRYCRHIDAAVTACFKFNKWVFAEDADMLGIGKYLGSLAAAGRSVVTKNHQLRLIKAFFTHCVHSRVILRNPCDALRMEKVTKAKRTRRRRALTDAEVAALTAQRPGASPDKDRRRRIYTVAAYSGLRRSELAQLTRADCDPRPGVRRWTLRPEITKNGEGGHLPMHPRAAEAILPLWEGAAPGQPVLGPIPEMRTIYADAARVGIPPRDERGQVFDFHALRFTFCRMMAEKYSIRRVKWLMRHASITLTCDLYGALDLDSTEEGAWTFTD